MAYLDDLLKGSTKTINNFDSFGGYSPLYGFSNEDELAKNPYQQILSSAPKEQTYKLSNPLNSGWLENRSMFNTNGSSLQIPDGINIDSTFYNRKDIYDLKQRLDASGIDIPDTKKDKPGIITRALDILSTPGYAMTTMLYNAFDNNKDTKVLKGLLDGIVGGLTSDNNKYKEGSDLVDLMVGEQKKDAGIGEKVGRFAGGMALDVLLDPMTYITLGTGAIAKGTAKVGTEVSQEAIEQAIKGINRVGDLADKNNVLDLATEAKRITDKINAKNVKNYDGLRFDFKVPFTKIAIEKEFVSPEKLAEISNKLGISKVGNKVTDTAKAMWNANKSETGIRSAIEKVPDTILGAIFNDADVRRVIKDKPLEAAQLMATKEVEKQLKTFTKKAKTNAIPKMKTLYNSLEALKKDGVDTSKMASIIEELETYNYTKELDNVKVFDLVKEFDFEAKRQLAFAETRVRNLSADIREEVTKKLQQVTLDYNDLNKSINNSTDEVINNVKKVMTDDTVDFGTPEYLDDVDFDDYDFGNLPDEYIDNARHDADGNRVFGEEGFKDELFEEIATDKSNVLDDLKVDSEEIADISEFEYKAPTPESINKEYKNYTNQNELDDLYNSKQWEGKQRHEIYQSVEAKRYTDELADFGMLDAEKTEKFINMPIEKQEAYLKKVRDYKIAKELGASRENVSKMLETGHEYFYENLMKHKKLTPEQKQNALDILKKYEEVDANWFGKRDKRKRRMTSTSNIARLQSDKNVFEKKNGALHKEYIPARTTDEIFAKVQKEVDDYSEKAERAKIQLQKKVEVNNVNTKLSKKEMVELLGKNGVNLEGVDTKNINTLRGLMESNNINIASTVNKKNFDNAVDVIMREIFGKNLNGKGRNNTYKKLKKIISDDLKNGIETGLDLPNAIESVFERNKKSIENRIREFDEAKKLLKEGASAGQDLFIDKWFELRASNLIDPTSRFYVDPTESLFENGRIKGLSKQMEGRWNDLEDIARRLYGEGEVKKLHDGTSLLLDGSMQTIFAKTTRLNGSVSSALRSEAQKYANNIAIGRGKNGRFNKNWDKEPLIRIKGKDGKPQVVTLKKFNKQRTLEGLKPVSIKNFPDSKVVSGNGLVQNLDEELSTLLRDSKTLDIFGFEDIKEFLHKKAKKANKNKEWTDDELLKAFNKKTKEQQRELIAEGLEDVKFYKLDEKKQQYLLKASYDRAEKVLDNDFWGGGSLEDILDREFKNQNKLLNDKANKNLSELSQLHMLDNDEDLAQEISNRTQARIEAVNQKKGIKGGFSQDKDKDRIFRQNLAQGKSTERMFSYRGEAITYDQLQEINKQTKAKLDKMNHERALRKEAPLTPEEIRVYKLDEIKLKDLKELNTDEVRMTHLNKMLDEEIAEYQRLLKSIPTNDNIGLADQSYKLIQTEMKYNLNRIRAIQDEQAYIKASSEFYSSARKVEDLTNKELVTHLKKNNVDLTGVDFRDKEGLIKLLKDNDIKVRETIEEQLDAQKLTRESERIGEMKAYVEPKDFSLSKDDARILNNLFAGDEEVQKKLLKPRYESLNSYWKKKDLVDMYSGNKVMERIRNMPNSVKAKVNNIPDEVVTKNNELGELLAKNGVEVPQPKDINDVIEPPTVKEDVVGEATNIVNETPKTHSGRINIDLQGKTAHEYQQILKDFGIEDERVNKLVAEYDKQKAIVEKAKKALDFSKDFIPSEESFRQYLDNMEELFGKEFLNFENDWYDKTKNKYDVMKNTNPIPKTPIELINDNSEVLTKYFGDSKVAREFVVDYIEYMRELGGTEEAWELFKENGLIKSQGYVPHRMSQEAMDAMGMTDGLESIVQKFLVDKKDLVYNEQKFAKSRTMSFNNKKSTIEELNKYIAKYLKEEKGIEINNFFETDIMRLIVQRTYEHSDALYNKGVQDLFVGQMGTKLSWTKGKSGNAYNIIEDISGNGMKWNREVTKKNGEKYFVNDFANALKKGEYNKIIEAIDDFTPKENFIGSEIVDRVKDEARKSVETLTKYLNESNKKISDLQQAMQGQLTPEEYYKYSDMIDNMLKKQERLKDAVYQSLPQRALAREYKDLIKKGDIVLVYPQGRTKEKIVEVIKEGVKDKAMHNHMFGNTDYQTISAKDFEKMVLEDKLVDVFALDKKTYDSYIKSQSKQMKKDTNAFLQLYDKLTNKWKQMAILSPGFHVRNNFGNYAQSYLDVGTKIFSKETRKLGNGIKEATDEVLIDASKSWNGQDLTGKFINELFENEFGDNTQIINELGKFKNKKESFDTVMKEINKLEKGGYSSIYEFSQVVGDNIEQQAKRRHFGVLLSEGLSPKEARDRVNQYLFDYADMTEFETEVMKRIIPFYTFMRKNMELQLNTLLEKPQTVKNARRLLSNQRKASVSTEERQLLDSNDLTKIIIPTGKGKSVTWDTNLPWFDNKSMLGSLNPMIKTPLELATNKNFTYGNDIEAYSGQVKEASPLEMILGGILGQTETGSNGEKYIDATAKHVITNALPTVRTADRMFDNFSTSDPISALMSAFGLGGQEFSVDKRTSQQVREYKELLENLEKKTQSKGIDTRAKLKEKQELERLLKALGV